jgi:hypothetical protein
VSLTCTSGSDSPSSTSASEAMGATFGVTNVTGAPTCTATESAVPSGYTSDGSCSAALSVGRCTIVNTASPPQPGGGNPSPTPTVPSTPTPSGSSTPGASPTTNPSATPGPGSPPSAPVDTPAAGGPPRIRPPSTGSGGLAMAGH